MCSIPPKWVGAITPFDEAGAIIFGYTMAQSPDAKVDMDVQMTVVFRSPAEVDGLPVIHIMTTVIEHTELTLNGLQRSVT
jgi:hypothetical protein